MISHRDKLNDMLNDSDRVSPRAQVCPGPPHKPRHGKAGEPLHSLNYQALGLRNPDTPESWAKVPICNHQITEDDKVLRMFKDVDFITSKIYSDCQVQS